MQKHIATIGSNIRPAAKLRFRQIQKGTLLYSVHNIFIYDGYSVADENTGNGGSPL